MWTETTLRVSAGQGAKSLIRLISFGSRSQRVKRVREEHGKSEAQLFTSLTNVHKALLTFDFGTLHFQN